MLWGRSALGGDEMAGARSTGATRLRCLRLRRHVGPDLFGRGEPDAGLRLEVVDALLQLDEARPVAHHGAGALSTSLTQEAD